MKKIVVIAQYSVYVDDSVTVSEVQDQAEKEIRDDMESIGIHIDKHDETIWLNLDDVMCGTETMVSVGGE